MAQRSRSQLSSSKNDLKRDVNEPWQHDLFEQYEALFEADEQRPSKRYNGQPAQKNGPDLQRNAVNRQPPQVKWSELERSSENRQPPQVKWSELERNAANRQPAQINLSNLEQNVSTEDLFDLFSLIGNLRDVHLDCDKYGRSEGTALIIFEQKVDAVEAMQRYNGCLLDNKAMKMELLSVPIRYGNGISNNIRSNGTATQTHMVDRSLVDHFNSLKLK